MVKDGYEPLLVHQAVEAPWYEWPGLDFFSENLTPWHIRDVREFRYQLQPHRIVPNAELENNAQDLRQRGASIGAPLAPKPERLMKPPAAIDEPAKPE